ncbi:MAG: FAD-binding oxidoreductase [Rhodospirillales bacterium]|nr:FAD-binding oxidoreductase [Rhodospirillales bacterium]
MGGASVADALVAAAPRARVVLLEREAAAGYHATGRSAALFLEGYKGPVIRALARASRRFFEAPPTGFCANPLLTPRGALYIAREDQRTEIERRRAAAGGETQAPTLIDGATARALVPVLRPEAVACALYEPDATDVDVDALLQGFLRRFRGLGGLMVTGATVRRLERRRGRWRVDTTAERYTATTVVNAAGAWADDVATMAGVAAIGLVPKRRTIISFDGPSEIDSRRWPFTIGVDEDLYFKPDAGRIIASPCDETPSPACDAQPDEWDVAVAADRVQTITTMHIQRIHHRWAGLRTFARDGVPVAGPDPDEPNFVWYAGQGGAGIITSAALGRMTAALATGAAVPADIAAQGVTAATLAPDRLRTSAEAN